MSKLKTRSYDLQLKNKKLREMRDVQERRKFLERKLDISLENIGKFTLDGKVAGKKNCENMIGVAQLPMGVAGPLKIISGYQTQNTSHQFIPLATTEGALVASVNRGCKAVRLAGGVSVYASRVGTTRAPVFKTYNLKESIEFRDWLEKNITKLATIVGETSSHLELIKQDIRIVGRNVFIRFYFDTRDAMGMNMVTIATQEVVEFIEKETGIKCLSVAGNFDIDKKPAWMNFIGNRGFAIWGEAILPRVIVREVLKVEAKALHDTWLAKCMIGSAMSGSLGFNAHYANIVSALFIATGQDPAHVVEGSLGVTTTNLLSSGDLYFSVYLPALMVGTVGGGTGLATQREALKLLGVFGGNKGGNAQRFAEIVAGAVLAGELSLIASEAEGSLAKTHQRLGRLKPKT